MQSNNSTRTAGFQPANSHPHHSPHRPREEVGFSGIFCWYFTLALLTVCRISFQLKLKRSWIACISKYRLEDSNNCLCILATEKSDSLWSSSFPSLWCLKWVKNKTESNKGNTLQLQPRNSLQFEYLKCVDAFEFVWTPGETKQFFQKFSQRLLRVRWLTQKNRLTYLVVGSCYNCWNVVHLFSERANERFGKFSNSILP